MALQYANTDVNRLQCVELCWLASTCIEQHRFTNRLDNGCRRSMFLLSCQDRFSPAQKLASAITSASARVSYCYETSLMREAGILVLKYYLKNALSSGDKTLNFKKVHYFGILSIAFKKLNLKECLDVS